jgi:hypothetical protein
MPKPTVTHIAYAADADGYTVRVLAGTQTIDERNAGNALFDSCSWVDPASGDAVDVDTLRKFAAELATLYAQQYGVPMEENTDLLPIREGAPDA